MEREDEGLNKKKKMLQGPLMYLLLLAVILAVVWMLGSGSPVESVTLSYLTRMLASRGAASIRLATLLDKPSRRAPGITLKSDYSGFVVGDEFVVGYGLDYAEHYRNLPYIGVLKPEVYQGK